MQGYRGDGSAGTPRGKGTGGTVPTVPLIYQKGWVKKVPRVARTKSNLNMYHVMLRGINRQDIFEDDEDRRYFMESVRICKEIAQFRLHAFCLMANHVHFLIEAAGEPLEIIFKRIGSRYVGWYNRKYQRVGHLFQDRFKSEPVETAAYFMTVLRYILQNPMKAGMENRPGSYRWSSYLAYAKGGKASVTDTQFAEDLFGGRDALIAFVQQENEDEVMDDAAADWLLSDEQAKEIMELVAGCTTAAEFQKKEAEERKACARQMYLEKLTMNQIVRMTGMSKRTVQRAVREAELSELAERQAIRLREESLPESWIEGDTVW